LSRDQDQRRIKEDGMKRTLTLSLLTLLFAAALPAQTIKVRIWSSSPPITNAPA
jgi:hypothetical protein